MMPTPGPWTMPTHTAPRTTVAGPDGMVLAEVASMPGEGEREANARLISAAPDLLAACNVAESLIRGGLTDEDEVRLLVKLRAAIAKAVGE